MAVPIFYVAHADIRRGNSAKSAAGRLGFFASFIVSKIKGCIVIDVVTAVIVFLGYRIVNFGFAMGIYITLWGAIRRTAIVRATAIRTAAVRVGTGRIAIRAFGCGGG